MKIIIRILLLIIIIIINVVNNSHATKKNIILVTNDDDCQASDEYLYKQNNIMRCSIAPPPGVDCKEYDAQGDWPNQVIYMNNLLNTLIDPKTCLNTTLAKNAIEYLDTTNTSINQWWYTWYVFQVQYYDMPRKPGARIESPATLGRKCWAFAYLAQIWPRLKPLLNQAMSNAGHSLEKFTIAYDNAIPLTMNLCKKVAANCFVNKTYNPEQRNGTCPDAIGQFYTGFAWENGNNNYQWRNDSVIFPFPRYSQTDEWRKNIMFAVNTALNYII